MKKYVIALFCTLVFLCGSGEAALADNTLVTNGNQRVFDEVDKLTDEQEQELEEKIQKLREEEKQDFAIAIVSSLNGWDPDSYADNFWLNNRLGYEYSGGPGFLLLVATQSRDVCVYISDSEETEEKINNTELDQIREAVTVYLKNDQYAKAADVFLDTSVKKLYEKNNFFTHFRSIFLCALVGLVIAMIITLILAANSKTKMIANGNTYMNKNEYHMIEQTDRFVHTTTVTHHIDKGGSRGGGGGHSHRSSSGKF